MSATHPLDRPIWSALTTGWSHVAEGNARARRLARDYGMFGAAADRSPESLAALTAHIPLDGELWTIERDEWPVPPGARLVRAATLVQMVAEAITSAPPSNDEIVALTDADAPEMFALATQTRPGPYVAHTNRLGAFVGIRHDGRLIAMAGERMRVPGFAEVSGVCTHPDFRGRGHAGALMRRVAERMIAQGETPILHAYADNSGAIALYEALGFRLRANILATVLAHNI